LLDLAIFETDEKVKAQLLNEVKSAGYSLVKLLNSLLDSAKVESNSLSLNVCETNLFKLLDESIAPVAVDCRKKNITFVFTSHSSIPEFIICDPSRLSQVINNLLSNAVKFTNKGAVKVDIHIKENGSEFNLDLSIRDSGIGISDHNLDHVFERFSKIEHDAPRRHKGMGLGLNITQKIIEQMKGSIEVNSSEGEGSNFSVQLQFQKSTGDKNNTFESQSMQNRNFAIVDELETSRLYLASLLRNAGFNVDVFSSGVELLKKKDSLINYAGVIIDLHVQDIQAFEIAKTITAMYADKTPEFVFISASAVSIDDLKIGYIGSHHAFVKPIDPLRFLDTVRLIAKPNYDSNKRPRPVTILLVEDEPINATIVETMLKNKGHVVTIATCGQQALDIIKSVHFDLILMDIQLPDFSGIEVTRQIRENLKFDTPIIALTGGGSAEDRLKTYNAGMKYHLVKPVQMHELHSVVELVIG
jgi:CheY-like chemotaxis protein/anti-sigma regulatory factor (Ser/Thr protein kinase)